MWPRIAELLIGLWLLASPWVLSDSSATYGWHINGLMCGAAIVFFSVLSFWPAAKRAHLAELPICLWLLGFTYFTSTHPASALAQSDILAALFLLNFAIIPVQTNRPPVSWRQFRAEQASKRHAPHAVSNVAVTK